MPPPPPWRHEHVPDAVVHLRHRPGHALDEEEAGDPRREEVGADRVVELPPHRLELEVEHDLEQEPRGTSRTR
ncbi:hypothetical protein DAI22_08g063366 [Oryza sativa Japonica Group]|nr:hypothetical protein DAI22_08g063366 [Oryza sativa Japonica Group]